jgi:hypothetical protein
MTKIYRIKISTLFHVGVKLIFTQNGRTKRLMMYKNKVLRKKFGLTKDWNKW